MRFETIMRDPPEGMVSLLETSNWGGRFFNWNDDYSGATSGGWAAPVCGRGAQG